MIGNGIELTLMIGPAVPVSASKDVIDALRSVKVTTTAHKASGFELVFDLSVNSPLETLFLVAGGASIPLVRVVIAVTVNGITDVLIDGVMTEHSVDTKATNGFASLTIVGEDLSRVMDYIDVSGLPYPCIPPEGQVALALIKYAIFGVMPMVIPSVMIDVDIPVMKIPRHQGTDLAHISRLARQVGYVFYLEPGPAPGTSIAYWGPEVKVGQPQPTLAVDADGATNVESLDFGFTNDRKVLPIVVVQEPTTKIPIPIPVGDISPLDPPLGLVPPIPKKIELITGSAKWSFIRAALIAMAKSAQSSGAVTASGSLDVVRYGRVLKARRLVGVRGAGTAFNGLYYVDSVTHSIKRGEYKQQFTLNRNGLISTLGSLPA
jgi:hypothetical protein